VKPFAIVREPIDPRNVEDLVRRQTRGAVVTFAGVVRERADDGLAIEGLTYEAHEAMALAEFEAIAGEAKLQSADADVAIHHRVGDVPAGEVSVVVAVGAVHRAAAFAACSYAIEELKKRAPIWKKERYSGGGGAWKSNPGAAAQP
jgi:molybdopterin synthase catalytic subunit